MAGLINAVRTTFSENLGGVAQALAPAATRFAIADVPDQTGKVAVVTGGSQGIGYGVTHTLLNKNIAKIFILSGSKDVVDKALDAVREELGEDAAKRTQWVQCDLGDWKRTTEAAKEIAAATDRLDILVNNAGRGIMTFELTDDGLDRHMAVNHMGHVVLTAHLLPLLKKTAEQGHTVRITNQASNLHTNSPFETKFANVEELNKDYGPNAQYGRSKLAAILYSRFLARHLTAVQPRILVNATHPGIVETKQTREDIHEAFPLAGYAMSVGMQPFRKSQFDGALSTLYAATKAENSGEYVCPPAAVEAGSQQSQDEELQEQLMRLTAQLIKEKIGQDLPSELQAK
jgi:NAD(P)-dependent dehydrogenase (short-subunit alcohol dehydrogenase family)